MTSEALPRLAYTREEAATICGVSKDTIARAKNAGLLKAKRLNKNGERSTDKGGKELYYLSDLKAWLDGLADA